MSARKQRNAFRTEQRVNVELLARRECRTEVNGFDSVREPLPLFFSLQQGRRRRIGSLSEPTCSAKSLTRKCSDSTPMSLQYVASKCALQ
jgi:hypothetical protein